MAENKKKIGFRVYMERTDCGDPADSSYWHKHCGHTHRTVAAAEKCMQEYRKRACPACGDPRFDGPQDSYHKQSCPQKDVWKWEIGEKPWDYVPPDEF